MICHRCNPLEQVAARLRDARDRSEPSALVVRGGSRRLRSGLIAAAIRHARLEGFEIIEVTGREDDRWGAHAGLISLLSSRGDRFGELPDGQADALRAALAMQACDPAPTPIAIRAATLSMLGLLSEDGPLLVTIEDGQWLDDSSAQAIAFAARRLVAEPVVVLIAIADGEPDVFGDLDEVAVGAHDTAAEPTAADNTVAQPTTVEARTDAGARFEREARRARAQGALSEAAHAWSEAAHMGSTDELSARRLFESATDLWMAGSVDAAIERYARAADYAIGHPDLLAEISLLAGQAIGWHRSPSEALGCLHTAAAHASDAVTSTACIAHASLFSSLGGDIALALELATKAETRAPADNPIATVLSAAVCGWQLLLAGKPEADERLAPAIALAPIVAAAGGPECLTLAQLVGLALVTVERWDEAVPLLETVHGRARAAGWQAASAFSAAALALVTWRRGGWDAAYATAVAGVEDAVSGAVAHAWSVSFLARITAGMGREDETRQLADAALEIGERSGAAMVSFAALAALGHLELSLGKFDAALDRLDLLATRVATTGLAEPGFLWWELDHLEALALAGRHTALATAIDRLDALAVRSGRRWAAGVVAHARALNEPGPEAERWYEQALGCYDELGVRFERARALLRRGQARLARRDTVPGRADLEEANAVFDELGATAWSHAAAMSCRRRRGAPTTSRPIDRLTQAELRVALAASSGKRNREIAADLYLSAKTVDYHLQSIYRTLQVRSRTELAVLLSGTSR